MYEITEYDCKTGETIVRAMTEKEKADFNALLNYGNSFPSEPIE